MSFFSTLRTARPVLAAFAAMGWGTFGADLPDIKATLGIDEARLGLLLFTTPIAAMLAMLATPWIGATLGRVALPVSALSMAAAFVLPGQVGQWYLFLLAVMACGAGTGATDVLMNSRASAIEGKTGVPLMNLTHAAYSFGYGASAVGTGVLRSQDWGPAGVFSVMAGVAVLLALLSFERDGRIEGLARPGDRAQAGLGWVPVIGGGIVLIAFLTENAAENWSALHIEKTLHGSPALGALGSASMALTMGCARLAGQGLAQRVAAVRLLLAGALVSACGALTVAGAGSAGMAYAGFIVMGIGSSVIAPTAFSVVGRRAAPEARARAVARATLLGYFGYFAGPPMLGFIAGSFGLRAAFVFAAAALLLVWVLGPLLVRRRG